MRSAVTTVELRQARVYPSGDAFCTLPHAVAPVGSTIFSINRLCPFSFPLSAAAS